MADPIMDLFDDPALFDLDPLTDDTFAPPPPAPPPPPEPQNPPSSPQNPPAPPPPDPSPLSQGNPFMGVATALPLPPVTSAAPPPPKIVILKAPPPGGGPAGSGNQSGAGKAPLAKVLPGNAQIRPVAATPTSGGGASGATPTPAAALQRLVGPGRAVKQLVLQPVKAGGGGGAAGKGGVALAPQQADSKRITLVLQQPAGGGASAGSAPGPAQRHVVLGGLPGKIVLQGHQLAALGQSKAAPGQAKVVTIQLQVQPPPGAPQGAGPKVQVLQSAPAGGGAVGVASVVGPGQRVTVPLKVVLQPQAASSSVTSPGLSVVKVLTTPDGPALPHAAPPPAARGPSEETRKLDHQKKQEKANRIVAEAIARARARGEQNIPRVLNEDELPHVRPEDDAERRRRRKAEHRAAAGKEEKARKGKGQGRSKGRSKPSTITPVVGKKRKRNASSDTSDAELVPAPSPRQEEETSVQKRRSNRQVKRKKYTEDLDIKLTDDEEDEELDVTGPARAEPPPPEPEAEALPAMQFFVENPSEEDAAIVDKVLSMRVVKKELPSGQFTESEEFFVKYKNYSYLHCEWATIAQLEKDKRIHQKLKRFKTKMTQMRHFFHEDEEPFNPDYVEVDRILDESHSVDKDNGEPVVYYLVKWCSLPYEDSTWELQEDVDEAKIAEFRRIQARHPEPKRLARPQAAAWTKLEASRQYKNHNRLREYQLEGVNWLLFNWYNRQNCILADEMGLGKTIQSIAFLQEVHGAGLRGPFLVIAPLSTIANWEREFNGWTAMNCIVYHGSLASRQMIQQYEMYCKDARGRLIPGAYKFDALVTTFEMILSDCPELREIQWRCVIIDEAHRLKNRHCKLLDSLKHMDLEHKVLLTGTPLQNTVEELFSLLHFLEPQHFPSEADFLKDFGDLKTEEQVQKLQAILKPMMLRRLKEDVEKNLAPKQETIIEVELTNIQKKYYRAILEKNFSFLAKGAGHTNMPNLLNTMMELRKCCNHPYLINGAEEKILAEFRESCPQHVPADFHLQAMVRSAGKLVLIDKLLPKLKAGGHKVLIFSQMVRCLDILEDYLIQRRYLYERIDGRVRGNLRQAAIDRFSKADSDRFVFLLCTRAGGLGINLTAADTCIIFDSDWNPQNDLQAQARCHRIGQSKAVKVYRLITRNSYEREMFDKASLKLGLDKAVLQSMSGRDGAIAGIHQFSKKEVEDLLRRGAYAAIMDEDDEGAKFCEEDIDQILLRRSTTITIETQGTGSTFAKASFVASENRSDIALDDPNFWQKWAKMADLDVEGMASKNTLVIDTPRVRKQTRHFALRDEEALELSEAESEDEERPRPRRHAVPALQPPYGRTDCCRVERGLLLYGWGRWRDMAAWGRFKRRLSERDVEAVARAILLFCLRHQRGEHRGLWELLGGHGGHNGRTRDPLALSGPPRGRRGRRVRAQDPREAALGEWARGCDPDALFQDEGYRRHLRHHGHKVLLRLRLLSYLRQELIGDQAHKVLAGAAATEIDIWLPTLEQPPAPTCWWDMEADKSLLIGVFKHGYERYHTMRADPALCFLEKAGRPDDTAIAAEQRLDGNDGADFDRDAEDPEYKPIGADEGDPLMLLDEEISVTDGDEGPQPPPGCPPPSWPPASVLTGRLRRLIGACQRRGPPRDGPPSAPPHRGGTPASGAGGGDGERRRRPRPAGGAARELARRERLQRWTRREQADFYRVASTFGVEFDPEAGRFRWGRFRLMAGLDKKTDENLTKFYHAFVAMCRQVCRLPPAPGDEPPDPTVPVWPISATRASRGLRRLSLLRLLREQVLRHPLLPARLAALCPPPGPDLPPWWQRGHHDGELLRGAARHGLGRPEAAILGDPDFSFAAARWRFLHGGGDAPPPQQPPGRPQDRESDGEDKVSASASESSSSSGDEESDEDRGAERSGGAEEEEEEEEEEDEEEEEEEEEEEAPQHCGEGGPPPGPPLGPPPAPRNLHDWPKERALLRRLELICRAVLSGERPPETFGGAAPPPPPAGGCAGGFPKAHDPPPFTRLRHEEKEFTVQIKDEEGLKLTFQKHRLVPNGAPPKKNSKKLVELELRCLEGLRDPGGAQGGEPPPPYPEKWPQKKPFLPPPPPAGLDLSKMAAAFLGGGASAGAPPPPFLPAHFRPQAPPPRPPTNQEEEEEEEAPPPPPPFPPLLADPMLPPTSDSD